MALTPGVLTVAQITSTTASINVTKPSDGAAPFTYQLYRSTTSGFSPGPGTAVGDPVESSEDSVVLQASGLIPGTLYYFDCIATEDGPSPDTANYTQISSTTDAPTQNPNQFSQTSYLGMVDLRMSPNTVSVQVDASQSTPLYCGEPVKLVDSAGGIPKVVRIAANSDEVFGFINYNQKNLVFTAGMAMEVSIQQNVIYLYATAAIARGARVVPNNAVTRGGVTPATGSTGSRIVGWAYDKATAAGQLIRVFLLTPSFELDS